MVNIWERYERWQSDVAWLLQARLWTWRALQQPTEGAMNSSSIYVYPDAGHEPPVSDLERLIVVPLPLFHRLVHRTLPMPMHDNGGVYQRCVKRQAVHTSACCTQRPRYRNTNVMHPIITTKTITTEDPRVSAGSVVCTTTYIPPKSNTVPTIFLYT